MRIALFGGTGFVGSYLVDALVAADIRPVLLVRSGHESRVRHPERCEVITGDVADADAVARVIDGADAVIFNIGLLREFPSRGVTFQAMHLDAACRTIDTAVASGVKRYLLMSANGVKAQGTPYQHTKYEAEQYLAGTDLEWTVFRPSVIFGDPRGRMEFATQLSRDIVQPPLPAPLFFPGLLPHRAGEFQLSPVHVEDVADAFVEALRRPETAGRILHLGGPATLSWRQILTTIAAASGKRKLMMPVPGVGVSAAATLLDRFESFPITRDQIRMLMEGNACGPEDLEGLGIAPKPFDRKHLRYLAGSTQESSPWQQNAA
jgi:NADH dehydrogenase